MNFKLLILFLLVFSLVSCLNGKIVTINGEGIDSDYFNDVYALSGGGMSKIQFFNDVMIPDEILFIDKMIPVRIYCTEFEIDKIIQLTLNHYDQEAVLAYEISSNVKLIKRK